MSRQAKEPTVKLSTMRTMWGVLAGLFALMVMMNMMTEKYWLASLQFVVMGLMIWYCASPPAYIRKKFIQDR